MAIKLHSNFAVHPGAWLRSEIVEPHGLSVTDAAARLHVTRQAMNNLLGGRAGLSAEMAIRFEKAFGLSADTLMKMQAAHDLAVAHERMIEMWRVAACILNLLYWIVINSLINRQLCEHPQPFNL